MATLTLNDWTVPIVGGDIEPVPCGEREFAFNGTPKMVLSGHKRRWALQTGIMDPLAADGLRGMCSGFGRRMPFVSDLWDDNGAYPSGTPIVSYSFGVDHLGAPIYNAVTGELESKFSQDGALWLGPDSENLVSSDSADAESAPIGYYGIHGATLGSDTTYYLHGGKSLKCTTTAIANSGVGITAFPVTGGNTYSVSGYVYTTEALSMDMWTWDGTSGGGPSFTSVANAWNYVYYTKTVAGGATTLVFQFRHKDATSKVFYVDCCQAEELGYPTAWIDRRTSATRTAPDLDYGSICSKSDALTFAAWVRAPTTEATADWNRLFHTDNGYRLSENSANLIEITRSPSTNNIFAKFLRADSGTTGTIITYATSPWDDGWHHIALVLCPSYNGSPYAALYYDGVVVASDTNVTYYPHLRGTQSRCFIGNFNSNNHWQGRIADVHILPFAMSTAQIAALAARTTATPRWPKLEAAGDFNMASDYQPEIVMGALDSARYAGSVVSGTHKATNERVSFSLHSVEDI